MAQEGVRPEASTLEQYIKLLLYHESELAETVTAALAIEPSRTTRKGDEGTIEGLPIPCHGWFYDSKTAMGDRPISDHILHVADLLSRDSGQLAMLVSKGWDAHIDIHCEGYQDPTDLTLSADDLTRLADLGLETRVTTWIVRRPPETVPQPWASHPPPRRRHRR